MPQYQGIWTLAQAAQLQSTQRWATDPLFENTTLLLQADNAANGAQNNTFLDSSSNNFTITRNGNTTQGSFTPYSLQPGAWSNYFDGTGDYLATPANAAFNVGTASFTLEAWIFPTSFASARALFSFADTNVFYFNTSGLPVYGIFGVSDTTIGSTTVPLNAWTHVAFVRSGSTLTCYLNGISVGSISTSSSIGNSTSGNSIGQHRVGNYFLGYISNLRLANGSAIYTSNFTPSAIPLTITSQGASSTDVKLLTCQSNRFIDNSTANSGSGFALTSFADVSVQAFSPFAPQYQYTPSVTGGSGYFDGTGDYLSAAANTALTFGTGDFTVEGWFYANALGGQPTILNNGSDAAGLVITMFSSKIYAYFVGAGNVFGSGGATIVTNTWYHFAWVRSGSTNTFYLNGAVYGATYSSAGNHASTGGVGIGYSVAGTAFAAWNGYIANVRMVKGTAVYTGAFTPPTAPPTAIANTSLLLNFTNAGIYDGTLKNNLETVGNAQVSTSVVKYGTGSMYFPASGNGLQFPSNALFTMGTGDFTIETWAYVTDLSTYRGVFQISGTSGGYSTTITTSLGMDIRPSNAGFEVYAKGASNSVNYSVSTNTWYHLAVVRLNGTTTFYVNGVSQATYTADTTSYAGPFLGVGNIYNGSYPFSGYIDDLRITRGIARYTANFIPPSVALPRQ